MLEMKLNEMSHTNDVEATHAINDAGFLKDCDKILAYAFAQHERLQLQVSQCRAISERTQEELQRHPELDRMSRRMYKRIDVECDETIHLILKTMELLEQNHRLSAISRKAADILMVLLLKV